MKFVLTAVFAATLLTGLCKAENAPAASGPAATTYIGILEGTPDSHYRLKVEDPAGPAHHYLLDDAGTVLVNDQITGETDEKSETQLRVYGSLEKDVLHVTSLEEYQEFRGWLSTKALQDAGHDPATLTADNLKAVDGNAPDYGIVLQTTGSAPRFLLFDASGQAAAAHALPKAGTSGGTSILAVGASQDGIFRVSRLLVERSLSGYVVTASFIADDRPLRDVTRNDLLDPTHAATGYGYVVNSCGGYEYFPFDGASQPLIQDLIRKSPRTDHIKLSVRGFSFWRDRTTQVTSASEDLSPEPAPSATSVSGLLVTRAYYLRNNLQLQKQVPGPSREVLLTPASIASYGIAYKPCCRLGFYRIDDAGRASIASLVKNSTTAKSIKVIAKGTLDLDLLKLTSVEEDNGSRPAASYPLKGKIVNLVPEESSLLIKHEAIPGFMAAMTMSFRVEPKVLQAAKKGQNVSATLRVRDDDYWLEDVQFLP